METIVVPKVRGMLYKLNFADGQILIAQDYEYLEYLVNS